MQQDLDFEESFEKKLDELKSIVEEGYGLLEELK
jgi:hypothetical protein